MTLKTQLVVKLEFTSSCSEADLYAHVENIVCELERHIKDTPNESWNNRVHVSWDESFGVDTYINISQSKIE